MAKFKSPYDFKVVRLEELKLGVIGLNLCGSFAMFDPLLGWVW